MTSVRRLDGFVQLGVLLVIALFAMTSIAIVGGPDMNVRQKSLVLSKSDEDSNSGSNSPDSNDSDEADSEDSAESEIEPEDHQAETPEPESSVIPTEQKTKKESKSDEISSDLKMRTESENKKNRTLVSQNVKKIIFETKNGISTIKLETEDGTEEEELADNEEYKLGGKFDDIFLESDDSGSILRQDDLKVRTNFPISINLETNELTITTLSGVKTVTVLPKQAIENLLRSKKISFILPTASPTPSTLPQESPVATLENELIDTKGNEIEIEVIGDEVLYLIQGVKEKKLFGVFNISIPQKFEVSAETGEVLNTNQSIFSQILDVLSF